jgi:ribonuclease D
VNPIPITTDDALASAALRLAKAPRLALDTEFMRERTYYAELAFLQVADGAGVLLIDPLAPLDRSQLAALLAAPGQAKVLHAARQDLEVLLPLTQTPLAPVLDTQLAAALLGHPPQIGYADLLGRELGVALDKGQARTDWTRRPLTAAQLAYAADDVRWLLPLVARLEEQLDARGRLGWFAEDAARLADPALYAQEPADAWQRFRGSESLPLREQARLRALAAWREARAMRRNLPRGWVLTDEAVRTLARAAPAGREALKGLAVMAPGAADKLGGEILDTLAAADRQPVEGLVQRPDRRPEADERELARRLTERLRERAAALALAPEVLATQRDLRRLARREPLDEVLSGWRRGELGPALAAELDRG